MEVREFLLWAWRAFWPGALIGATFFSVVFSAIIIQKRLRTGQWGPP